MFPSYKRRRVDEQVVIAFSCRVGVTNSERITALTAVHFWDPKICMTDGAQVLILRRQGCHSPHWVVQPPICNILGVGMNNDGFTKEGLTFPNGEAQTALSQKVGPGPDSQQSLNHELADQFLRKTFAYLSFTAFLMGVELVIAP